MMYSKYIQLNPYILYNVIYQILQIAGDYL